MLEKTLRMNQLIDFYLELLTPHQQALVQLYYREDLSLAEIAEQYDISRQGVHSTIKQAEALLEDYEATLGLLAQQKSRHRLYKELEEAIDQGASKDELSRILQAIKDLDD